MLNKCDSQIRPKKHDEPVHRLTVVSGTDPLLDLIQNMSDLYEKPLEMLWNGTQFGIPNVQTSFFIIYYDVNEIILGDKCLNISILQLWMM